MKKAPLGAQPRPLPGNRSPDYSDESAGDRAAEASAAFKTIWIDHPPQAEIIARVLKLRRETLGKRGVPLGGLRLSQDSQAGKSSTFGRLKNLLGEARAAEGLPANEYQVLIVGLDKKTSLKSVYQDILLMMHDPDWDKGTEKALRVRVSEFVVRLEVEILVIDEVQHLRREGNDVNDVTDAIKRFLDTGIVPVVLVGNLDSKPFFERNGQLSSRLGRPLDLTPLDADRTRDLFHFKNFCTRFDEALVQSGASRMPAGLDTAEMLEGLSIASGGHIGRVARILENAVDHAAWRGALTVEPYDLSQTARTYAMPTWKLELDPFSRVAN